MDRHLIEESLLHILDRINLGFFVIFLLEMIIKQLGLGFKNYFYDSFNSFDFLIIILSIIDVVMTFAHSGESG